MHLDSKRSMISNFELNICKCVAVWCEGRTSLI